VKKAGKTNAKLQTLYAPANSFNMSMLCLVGQISDNDIEKIKVDPKRVELLINEGNYFEEKGFFKKMFSKKSQADWVPNLNEPKLDLDKSWDGINFFLSGNPQGDSFPENFLVTGGTEIGDDYGYGPVRFVSSNYLVDIKNFLDSVSKSDFERKYSAEDLNTNNIYPLFTNWTNEEINWLTSEFIELKNFIELATKTKKGIYIYIY
jgi:hypothetical protein